MVGYVQDRDIATWLTQLCEWVERLEGDCVEGWSAADRLEITAHDRMGKVAALRSDHARQAGLSDIRLDHLWIEM